MPSSYYSTQTQYVEVDEGTQRTYTDESSTTTYYDYSGSNWGGSGYKEVHHHHHHYGGSSGYGGGSTGDKEFRILGLVIFTVAMSMICFVGYSDKQRKKAI